MEHKGRLAIVIAVLLTLAGPVQAATPKAGAKCTKMGTTATAAGKKFTCIKSGTKLVWNKGVSIKAAPKPSPNPVFKPVETTPTPSPTPVPTPTPTATPSPTPTPTPTPTPLPTIPPTSFNDLYERRDAISYTAWKLTADAINAGQSQLKLVTVFTGPNTNPKYTTPETAYALVSKAFSGYKTPDKVYTIRYSIDDLDWAEEKTKSLIDAATYKIMNDNEGGQLLRSNCRFDCFGSKQVTSPTGVAFIFNGVPKGSNGDPMAIARWELGHTDAHEFFHAMQRLNSSPPGTSIKEWPVGWIVEGGATVAGHIVMTHTSFEDYSNWRTTDSLGLYRNKSTFDMPYIERFLDLKGNTDYWRGVDSYYSYNLGGRIMEVFVALKGPGVLLELHKQTVASGFEKGFATVFGTSWSEASPIIAKVVFDQIQNGK